MADQGQPAGRRFFLRLSLRVAHARGAVSHTVWKGRTGGHFQAMCLGAGCGRVWLQPKVAARVGVVKPVYGRGNGLNLKVLLGGYYPLDWRLNWEGGLELER